MGEAASVLGAGEQDFAGELCETRLPFRDPRVIRNLLPDLVRILRQSGLARCHWLSQILGLGKSLGGLLGSLDLRPRIHSPRRGGFRHCRKDLRPRIHSPRRGGFRHCRKDLPGRNLDRGHRRWSRSTRSSPKVDQAGQ